MRKSTAKPRSKKAPKRVLALPDLEQSKAAVLNRLTSASGQRTYDHAIQEFVAWYCSEPRLAFNRTVVLRYRIHLEQRHYAPATINLRLAAVRRVAYEAADAGLLSPELAARLCHLAGGELDQIQFLLGHVSIQTTERYLGEIVSDHNRLTCCGALVDIKRLRKQLPASDREQQIAVRVGRARINLPDED